MIYSADIYIRLSKEDDKDLNENSESVINQRKLLVSYVLKNNYNLYDIYIDDGYTGTNFNRPAFKRMIKDIEDKKVNMVIVKDLSRLGRDYIKTGEYIENWFPIHRVRFIAILDRIDTLYDNSNNDFLPFKSIINDMYSKDNSKKIRAALRVKQQEGKWVGGCPPFGYMTDKNDKNHLVINEDEAFIVRKIFSLAVNGLTVSGIAKYMYENKIDTPLTIRKSKRICKYSKLGYWSDTTIKSILNNVLYTGDMVQNRRQRLNYKMRNIIKNNIEDWIIVEKTHEAIIDKDTFNKVQKTLKLNKNNRINKNSFKLLDNLLYCYECKKKLIIQKYTMCNTYRKYSKLKLCSSHSNNYCKLEKYIINILKKFLKKTDIKEIDREVVVSFIKKIEIHDDKTIEIYCNFKKPSFIA